MDDERDPPAEPSLSAALWRRHPQPVKLEEMDREGKELFESRQMFEGVRATYVRMLAHNWEMRHDLQFGGSAPGPEGMGGSKDHYSFLYQWQDSLQDTRRIFVSSIRGDGNLFVRSMWPKLARGVGYSATIERGGAENPGALVWSHEADVSGRDWRLGLRHTSQTNEGHSLSFSFSQSLTRGFSVGAEMQYALSQPIPSYTLGTRWVGRAAAASAPSIRPVWTNMLVAAGPVMQFKSIYFHPVDQQISLAAELTSGNMNQTQQWLSDVGFGFRFFNRFVGASLVGVVTSGGVIKCLLEEAISQTMRLSVCVQLDNPNGTTKLGLGLQMMS